MLLSCTRTHCCYKVGILCLSVRPRFCDSRLKSDPHTHVYIYIYIQNQYHQWNVFSMSIWPYPFLYFKKKAKNGTFARKEIGATRLKLCMHTQLDSGSNMGWILLGHTFSSWCIRLKCQKWYLKKTKQHSYLSSYINEPIYIWNQCCQGNILRMSIRPHPFLCSWQA